MELLLVSVATGDLDRVREAIEQSGGSAAIAVNEAGEDGKTPLMEAARRGHLDIARLLVEKGAHLHLTDKYGFTALSWAERFGNSDVEVYLRAAAATNAREDDDGDQIDSQPAKAHVGGSNITFSSESGSPGSEEAVPERKRGKQQQQQQQQEKQRHKSRSMPSSIADLANLGDLMGIKEVVERQRDREENKIGGNRLLPFLLEQPNPRDRCKYTPLMLASGNGHLDVVAYLIKLKANVNSKTEPGYTALMLASITGFYGIVKCLLERNADVNIASIKGYTAVMFAAENDHLDILKYLVENARASFTQRTSKKGYTALTWACRKGHLEIVRYLVEQQQAEVNHASNKGVTPLMFAAEDGSIDLVRYLVEVGGAELGQKDSLGRTGLTWAKEHENHDAFEYLQGALKLKETKKKMQRTGEGDQEEEKDKQKAIGAMMAGRPSHPSPNNDINSIDRSQLIFEAVPQSASPSGPHEQLQAQQLSPPPPPSSSSSSPLLAVSAWASAPSPREVAWASSLTRNMFLDLSDNGLLRWLRAVSGKFGINAATFQDIADEEYNGAGILQATESTLLAVLKKRGRVRKLMDALQPYRSDCGDGFTGGREAGGSRIYGVPNSFCGASRHRRWQEEKEGQRGNGRGDNGDDTGDFGGTYEDNESGRGNKGVRQLGGVSIFDEDAVTHVRRLGKGASGEAFLVKVALPKSRRRRIGESESDRKRMKEMVAPSNEMQAVLKIPFSSSKGLADPDVMRELGAMASLRPHPNVLEFLGVVPQKDGKAVGFLTAYCERGSLDKLHNVLDMASPQNFLRAAQDVCAGLAHLHHDNMIHRDLACRNLFMGSDYRIVIADYGLSRKLPQGESRYYIVDSKLPWQWSAPEVLRFRKYDKQADVWSLGVTLWEILTKGAHPYGVSAFDAQVLEAISSGRLRLVPPKQCPKEIKESVLDACFSPREERPSAVTLLESIRKLLDAFSAAKENASGSSDHGLQRKPSMPYEYWKPK